MIYVDRSRVPEPEVLRSDKAQVERERIRKLLRGEKDHVSQLRMKFETGIYAGARPVLLELFHNKCAYCESAIGMRGPANIEHFRPKMGATDLDGKRSLHYYAWLAYDWENLLVACSACNVGWRDFGKRESFPVDGERAPLLASVKECREVERALLLDPCFDRPERSLSFRSDGSCVPEDRRGEATLTLLGLNDRNLMRERAGLWERVSALVRLTTARSEVARQSGFDVLISLVSGRLPYTAAARSAFLAETPKIKRKSVREDLMSRVLASVDEPARLHLGAVPVGRKGARRRRNVPASPESAKITPSATYRFEGKRRLPRLTYETIRRVEIRNFKAIESLDLDFAGCPPGTEGLAPATVLLGENAAGKSTVLEAVTLTLLGTKLIHKLGLDGKSFIRRASWEKEDKNPAPAHVVVHFEHKAADNAGDKAGVLKLRIDPKSGKFTGNPDPATIVLAYGPRRFFADRRRGKALEGLADQVRTLFDPLAVIENPNGWLLNAEQPDYDSAVRALRPLLLLADEAVVSRPEPGQRKGAQIMFEIQGEKAPLNRLSEGYKTVVAMAVDIMRELLEYWPDLETARGVVLVDELENHLHPRWKMRIVSRLRQAMPRVQFICTSHDPLCLRGLYDGEANILHRDEQRRIERLLSVPNVRGLSVEQLLTSEYFGLFSTEDPSFEEQLARYAELVAKPNRTADEEADLERQRSTVHGAITVGQGAVEQVIQEAASEYLAKRRSAPAEERPSLKRSAIDRVLEVWRSRDPEETVR